MLVKPPTNTRNIFVCVVEYRTYDIRDIVTDSAE